MRVQDVMTPRVQTTSPGIPAEGAWNLMRVKGVHHLVVTDESRIVGVLSDRDIGGRHGAPVRRDHTVGDLMTARVVTVAPDTPVRKAANLMRGRSIGCLVVVDRERPVGIVTVADLLELIGRGIDRPVATTKRWTLRHRVPHTPRSREPGAW